MKSGLDESWTWSSWIVSANEPACDFPLQNLPFCAFEPSQGQVHLGVGIGSFILDLHGCVGSGLLDALPENTRAACGSPHLNALMQCGAEARASLRRALMALLKEGGDESRRAIAEGLLLPIEGARFQKPVAVGNYTDFYASIHHATNVGRQFRPEQPLLPNYKWIPIGYHGRASSLVISGTPVTRPSGQTKPPTAQQPSFEPSRQLDFELEVGAYIGGGNRLGHPIPIDEAEQHFFGISLVNDWSARDIQSWEYQPLGPFLGKSFAASVSPWVVTMEALAPYRVPRPTRAPEDPEPLPYLTPLEDANDALDIKLEAYLSTALMRAQSAAPARLTTVNSSELYWSFAQMIAHHTSNGCNLLPGDLIASGTVSGAALGAWGSMLEITDRGASPMRLANGEFRSFLEDGDEIILSGFCERPGLPRIGLGVCRGTIVSPAV